MTTEQRLIELEAGMQVLRSRVITLERLTGATPSARPDVPQRVVATPAASPRSAPSAPPRRTAPTPLPRRRAAPAQRQRVDLPGLEDLIGGRVLAWVGGAAVVLGLAFFFALAVSRGWISEPARLALGTGLSLALLAAGVWLREHKSRNEAAMAAAATGLGGLFLAIVVAAQVYDLVPSATALACALVVGAFGTVLALRWNAQVIGALGTLGAALSPVLAGTQVDEGVLPFLFVATAAGATVLVYKRWTWLALALVGIATPQWAPAALSAESAATVLLACIGFGGVGILTAVGFDVRSGGERLRVSSAFLLVFNALLVTAVGWYGLWHNASESAATGWLVALAVAHAAAAAIMRPHSRVSKDLGLLLLALAVILGDLAWAQIVDGAGVGVGWAASATGFAWVASRSSLRGTERRAAMLGLGGHVALAVGHVLTTDVTPDRLGGGATPDGMVALAIVAAACLVSGRLAEDGFPQARLLIDAVGLVAVAYLTAAAFDGPVLVVALALEACALAAISRVRDEPLAQPGALALTGLAALHALVYEAPPASFLYGTADVVAALLASAAVAGALARIATTAAVPGSSERRAMIGGAAVAALYGLSVAIVSSLEPTSDPYGATGVLQQGQMLVSAMWSVVGATALVAGLTRDHRELRLAGLALLLAAIAKVFLFDLATLDSVYRVVSFLGVGVVLLIGAYAWQRLRPEPLPDLRRA